MTGLERLHEIAKSSRGYSWAQSLSYELEDIAQTIEREQEELSKKEKLADSYKSALNDVCKAIGLTDGTGLPEMGEIICDEIERRLSDDHEIAEWVREHGGIEVVRNRDGFAEDMLSWIRNVSEVPDEMDLVDVDEEMSDIDKRLMPPGYEWPRYEDGEKVECNDKFLDGSGRVCCVTSIEIMHDETGIVNDALIHWDEDNPMDALLVCMWQGERVKRPKPEPIGADGLPIEIGETVYEKASGREVHVSAVDRKGKRFTTEAGFAQDRWLDPLCFTHAKTEPPDSWERLEQDARELVTVIADKLGDYDFDDSGRDSVQTRVMGLVRRAKSLSERDDK